MAFQFKCSIRRLICLFSFSTEFFRHASLFIGYKANTVVFRHPFYTRSRISSRVERIALSPGEKIATAPTPLLSSLTWLESTLLNWLLLLLLFCNCLLLRQDSYLTAYLVYSFISGQGLVHDDDDEDGIQKIVTFVDHQLQPFKCQACNQRSPFQPSPSHKRTRRTHITI